MTPFQIAVKQINAILLLCLVTMGVMYLQLFHTLSSRKLFILNALKNFTG